MFLSFFLFSVILLFIYLFIYLFFSLPVHFLSFFQMNKFLRSPTIFFLTINRFNRLAEIRWSVCISKSPLNFVGLIFQDGFWILRKPFVRMVKFKLLAQFPRDHFARPIVSSLICNYVLIRCNRLCDWSFRLYYHTVYICYSVASCLFLLWHS